MTDPLPSESLTELDYPPNRQSGGLWFLYRFLIAVLVLIALGLAITIGLVASGFLLGDTGSSWLDSYLGLASPQGDDREGLPSTSDQTLGENAPLEPIAVPPPQPTSRTQARLATPARIRIPEIEVDRAIIALPAVLDSSTGGWSRDVESLFRTGRNDLVGHWGGSSLPGEPGNMILVGHNYGYGTTGVFLRIGRLKPGQEITVLTRGGTPYLYRVKAVEKIPWRRKNLDEMIQHSQYLAVEGEERLTLVTCGGASRAPFPQNIYVVAEPVNPGSE